MTSQDLKREAARIFRVTHIDNVPWILRNGIHCQNSSLLDPNFREIGLPDLIQTRKSRIVPVHPGGTLADYVPFYFTPWSPMLYKLKTGHGVRQVPMSEIVILISSLGRLAEVGATFLYTDRHASLQAAVFNSNLDGLDCVDWKGLQSRDFKHDPDQPDKLERYQAEALVYRVVPLEALLLIACHGGPQRLALENHISRTGVSMRVVERPAWYF